MVVTPLLKINSFWYAREGDRFERVAAMQAGVLLLRKQLQDARDRATQHADTATNRTHLTLYVFCPTNALYCVQVLGITVSC